MSKTSLIVAGLVGLGIVGMATSVEAIKLPRNVQLRLYSESKSGVDSQQQLGQVIELSGKLPSLQRRSTIIVSVSFDETTVTNDRSCAIANMVAKEFPQGPYPFVTNATIEMTHFLSGDVLNAVITGGMRCAIEPIDDCPTHETTVNFAFTDGTGRFINTSGRGTIHLITGKCDGELKPRVYRNDLVLWEVAQ